MATIDVCDACGKRLDWKVSTIKFKKVSYYISFRHYAVEDYEFCSDCYNRLMRVLLNEKRLIEDENN